LDLVPFVPRRSLVALRNSRTCVISITLDTFDRGERTTRRAPRAIRRFCAAMRTESLVLSMKERPEHSMIT